MASQSPSLTANELPQRRPLLDRLAAHRGKPLLTAIALASIVLLAFVGLTDLSLPVLIGILVLAAGVHFVALRLHFETPAAEDSARAAVVTALETQVGQTRNDGPSGLHQRWYMEWRLRQECARCRRYGLSLALIYIKVEGRVGVPSGQWLPDASRAAQSMVTAIRNIDLAAEMAPGEYAVSLVHCDEVAAIAAMGRLAHEMKGFRLQTGHVVFPNDDVSSGELIELARSRLEPWGEGSDVAGENAA